MKKLAIVVAVAGLLSACGTTSQHSKNDAVANPQTASNMKAAASEAPEWMSRLPKSPNAVYENGTATSGDFGMADLKAKTIAYSKICTAAGGKVRSQTKMFMSDNGTTSTEQSETAIRSICADVDITGVETIEMKHVAEGNRIRAYVLIALPIGGANVMKSSKESMRNSREAFRELDEVTGNRSQSNIEATPATAVKGQEISVVRPDGSSGTLNLMPVENAEYRARRAEVLQKPGAVVGQVTINN
jgi:hypothetical protein